MNISNTADLGIEIIETFRPLTSYSGIPKEYYDGDDTEGKIEDFLIHFVPFVDLYEKGELNPKVENVTLSDIRRVLLRPGENEEDYEIYPETLDLLYEFIVEFIDRFVDFYDANIKAVTEGHGAEGITVDGFNQITAKIFISFMFYVRLYVNLLKKK